MKLISFPILWQKILHLKKRKFLTKVRELSMMSIHTDEVSHPNQKRRLKDESQYLCLYNDNEFN